MARKLEVEIVGDARSLERAFGRAGSASSRFGSTFGRLGSGLAQVAKVGAAAGLALGAVVAAGAIKATHAASDLGEQISKANVVFAKSGREVVQWASGLARSFGLSQRAALEAAGTFGNMLVPMGFARSEAAGMSKQFVELAGDMASFNNASPEETLEALRAGLAGETEPLRRFGVFLSEARIKAQALEMGLYDGKGALDAHAKAAATAAVIMKDTADTQGDFARTSDSLANRQRILAAEFENAAAKIGRALLPAATALLGVAAKIIPKLTEWGQALAEKLGPAVSGVADALSSMLERLGKAQGLKAKVQVILEGAENAGQALFAKVKAAIAAVNWAGVWAGAMGFAEGLAQRIETGMSAVDWTGVAASMMAGLSKAFQGAVGFIDTIFSGLVAGIERNQGKLAEAGALIVVGIFSTLLDPMFWVEHWDLALGIGLLAFMGPLGRLVGKLASVAATALVRAGEGLVLGLAAGVARFAPRVGELLVDAAVVAARMVGVVGGAALRAASSVLEAIWAALPPRIAALLKVGFVAAVVGAVQAAVAAARTAAATIASAAGDFYEAAKKLAQRIVDAIRDVLMAKLHLETLGQLRAVPAALRDAAAWAYEAARGIGKAIVDGIIDGTVGLAKRLGDAMLGPIDEAIGGAKRFIESHSPSMKTAREIGGPLAQGVIHGWLVSITPLPQKMTEKLREAIEQGRQAIAAARSTFETAFSELASAGLAAFDAIAAKARTPAEKMLERMDLERRIREIKERIEAAQAEFASAQAGGDPAEIAAAQRRLDDALYEQTRFGLEQRAAVERAKLDEKTALRRQHFEERLRALQDSLAREGASHQEAHKRVMKIFAAFKLDYKTAGDLMGAAIVEGIRDSLDDVEKAAGDIADAIRRHLRIKSPAEEGPLSDLDKWWDNFVPTLTGGLDLKGLTSGVDEAVAAGAGGGGVAVIPITLVLDGEVVARTTRRHALRVRARSVASSVIPGQGAYGLS